MTDTLEYFIQSSGILAVFYLIYFLFLRNERYFVEIRVYLVLSLILTAILPFVKIPYAVLVQSSEVIMPSFDFTPTIASSTAVPKNQIDLVQILLMVYLVVALAMLFRSCLKIWQIFNLIKGKHSIDVDNCKVFLMDEKIPAFSFFGYIIINKEEYHNDTNNNIFIHEKVHAMQKHWIDLLLIELMSIVFWFNPFVWLFQIAIKQTHELLADDGVIARGFGIGQYQAILINQLMGAEVVGLANNFNYSLNKKRMIMMSKEKGLKIRRYKILLMIPVIVFVLAFNMKAVQVYAKDSGIVETQEKEVTISGVVLAEDGKPIPGTAVMVEGTKVGTVTDINGKFELMVAEDANVKISFVGLETRTMAVEDFVLNGKKSKNYFLKIKMKAHKALPAEGNDWRTEKKAESKSYDPDEVFVIVEQMPKFPGGEQALRKYFEESIVYPAIAKENGIKGRVFVTYVVNKEGKVERAKVIRGIDPSLDKEALRVVEAMPNWEPGYQRGKKVNVSYTFPVNFGVTEELDTNRFEYQGKKATILSPQKEFNKIEEMPKFPGGQMALRKHLAQNVKYPKEAQLKNITGKVYVTFVVTKQGMVDSVRIAKGVAPSLDEEAIRVVKTLPKWEPGKNDGKPVHVTYTVPINFDLKDNKGTSDADKGKSKEDFYKLKNKPVGQWNGEDVYVNVDDMPEFPGGHLKLKEYLDSEVENLDNKYLTDKRCFITFLVTKEGKVDNLKIAKGTGNKEVDSIAMKIVKNMPDWKPGKENGKAAHVTYTVPVHFSK